MSSEIGQNPSVIISNIAPKMSKQIAAKNKSSKRFSKNKTDKNKDNISNQNKPLKVVYISNPVKFKVNADEFQALVQGLTGRDAIEWTEGNSSYSSSNNNSALDVGPSTYSSHGGVHHNDEVQQEISTMDDYQLKADDYRHGPVPSEMSLDYFGSLDDYEDNKGQMIDYYQGFPGMYD